MKNRHLAAFAFAGMIGFGACAAEEDNIQFEDTTPAFEDAPIAPPIAPAPMTTDTMLMPPVTDTTVGGTGDPALDADSIVL